MLFLLTVFIIPALSYFVGELLAAASCCTRHFSVTSINKTKTTLIVADQVVRQLADQQQNTIKLIGKNINIFGLLIFYNLDRTLTSALSVFFTTAVASY